MGLFDLTFYDMVNRNATAFGDKTAWFEADDHRSLSFAEYKNNIEMLASGLQLAGINKGDRIGILGKNSLEYFLLYGAGAILGAILVPVNWRLSVEEVCFNFTDCEPAIVFVDDEFQENIKAKAADIPAVKRFFNLSTDTGGFEPFDSLMEKDRRVVLDDVASSDGFIIIHTAAVAGRPRGALLSHENILSANIQWNYCLRLSPDDVHLNLLPLFHIAGLIMATAGFHAGAVNINMSKFEGDLAVSLIEEKKVTFFFDFSPILSTVLEAQERTGKNIESLQAVVGLDTPEIIEKYQDMTGGTYYAMYGQTETSSVATCGQYNDRPGSAGKVIPSADVILMGDDDNPVPVGEVGEIAMKGPLVFRGYWNLPEDTAHTFRDGWHHTGDLARFDADGFLFYAGRKAEKELIKPGGENVYPAEVEKAILEHPAVAKTVVFGVPDPKWKEGIKAVCLLHSGYTLKPEELIEFVGERIARYKKPQYVECVTDFPELENGDPDRKRIKEMYGGS